MNKKEIREYLKENLRIQFKYDYDIGDNYIRVNILLEKEVIASDYLNTRPENRELGSLCNMYNAYRRHDMQVQAEAVKKRILEMLNEANQKEFLKTIKKEIK